MIKAVLVDVDDTLLDFDESAKMSMNMSAAEQGIQLPENIWEVFVQINEGLWHDLEKGLMTSEELFHVRWTKIFDAVGIDADGPVFEQGFLRGLSVSAPLIAGAREIMEYLHSKYIVGIASNGPYEQQVNRLTKVGVMPYVDKLFVSGKIGHAKPKKEFFDACLEELDGIKPEEIMMIGDSISADISGAKAYGMQTCWYNHKKENQENGKLANYIVDSLLEIKEIL